MSSDDQIPTDDPAEGDTPDVVLTRVRRYRNFARHMASCENASKAARLAGYSIDSAGQQGHRMMLRPDVQALVAEERAARAARLVLTEERITAAYTLMAFADTRGIVQWDDNGVALVSRSDDLTDDEAMLVQSVERKERTDAAGNTTSTTVVKLADRKGALDALARIKGMNKDKLDVTGIDGFAAKLRERVARRKGEGAPNAD